MSKKNYGKYYKDKPVEVEEPIILEEESEESIDDFVPEELEEVVEEPVPEEPKVGSVNCRKLNVRSGPSKDHTIISTIVEGTVVQIEMSKSDNDFYAVYLPGGQFGYCMKQFISLI